MVVLDDQPSLLIAFGANGKIRDGERVNKILQVSHGPDSLRKCMFRHHWTADDGMIITTTNLLVASCLIASLKMKVPLGMVGKQEGGTLVVSKVY